jgi:hypothetical protein
MYQDITEQSAVLEAIENSMGTDAAEQCARLYEDLLEDHDQFNLTALREVRSYLADHPLTEGRDPDATYILNQCVSMISVLQKAEDEAQAEAAVAGVIVPTAPTLNTMIALAVGSERAELLPSPERIAESFQPNEDTTPNEAALMKNLQSWIEFGVEGARVVIEKKREVAKLENEKAAFESRLAVIDALLTKGTHQIVKARRCADESEPIDNIDAEGSKLGLW